MAGFGGLGLKEDLVELALDIDALVAQTVSSFVDCAKTRTVDGNLIHVTNLFFHKAELFRKLVRRVNTRNKTEKYIKELENCGNNVNNIVIDKASDTQEAFNLLSSTAFLAKKTHAKAEQESRYVEPEEIVRYSHLISKNFSVCSPHFWQQGDSMRPFPTDIQFRCSSLTQSEGIASPKELHEVKEEAEKSDMNIAGASNLFNNAHDGGLRDLKMNDLPVLNDYSSQNEMNTSEMMTQSNGTNIQSNYNIGLISSDEDSSDSDF